jgi:putative transposase
VWHLDEVIVTIGGRKYWLWRAVDQDGYVLDEIVQTCRNTKAARRLLSRLMTNQGCLPKRIVTDKLRSYGTARRQLMPTVVHRSYKGLNNRAENSHLPLRKRERGACSDFARRARCNASSASSPRSEISSFPYPPNAQLSPFIRIALQRWHIGRSSPGQRPDPACIPRRVLDRVNLTSPRGILVEDNRCRRNVVAALEIVQWAK